MALICIFRPLLGPSNRVCLQTAHPADSTTCRQHILQTAHEDARINLLLDGSCGPFTARFCGATARTLLTPQHQAVR